MTQDSFIHFVRLVKRLYNDQQGAVEKGYGYLGTLKHLEPLAAKVDAQLKLISSSQEVFYDWLPKWINLVREWRSLQKLYLETEYESQLMKCRDKDRIMDQGFNHIKQNSTHVLETPQTQQTLFPQK